MQISSVKLLVILVGFSYVVSATAVPATRTQNLKREDASSVPSLPEVDAVKLGNGAEELQLQVDVEEEGFMERRMDLQTQDYGGTGANKDHDPKTPGTD